MLLAFSIKSLFLWLFFYPGGNLIVASLFLALAILCLAVHRNAKLAFAAAIGWAIFAAWQLFCKTQGYNIRVDMILIAPVLLALTLGGLIAPFHSAHVDID